MSQTVPDYALKTTKRCRNRESSREISVVDVDYVRADLRVLTQ